MSRVGLSPLIDRAGNEVERRQPTGSGILRPPTGPPANSALAPVPLDPHLYRSMCQDITVVKTLLLRLKNELSKVTNPPGVPVLPS